MKGQMYNANGARLLQILIEDTDMELLGKAVAARAAELIADAWVREHGAEVLAKITPEAVATMALAEAGAAVNETLHKKLPDKIVEVVREQTRVYQRGIFGGMTRIR